MLCQIKDYFGEQIALYFAFIGLYTKSLFYPVVFGLITYIGQMRSGIENNPLTFYFSIFLAFWSLAFTTQWTRRQNELAFLWGTETHSTFEKARPEFVLLAKNPHVVGIEFSRNPVTQKIEAMVVNSRGAKLKKVFNACLVALCMAVVLCGVVCCQYIKLIPIGGSVYAGKMLGSILNGIFITLFGLAFERVARVLTQWEHPRTDTEFENSLIAKSFVFDAVNNFACLFYITFFRSSAIGAPSLGMPMRNQSCTAVVVSCSNSTLNEALLDQCVDGEMQVPSCISDLSFQLAIILIINQVVGGVMEIGIPTYKAKVKALRRDLRIKKVQKQMRLDAEGHEIGETLHATHIGDERVMTPYRSVHADYKELAVQWGNVLLFASAFPMAPVFALINNLIEIRADAYKLCKVHRRPEYKTKQDIGAWALVFNTISCVSVITNAAIVSFVGSQAAEMWDRTEQYDEVGVVARIGDPTLWLVAGLTEHAVLGLRFVLGSLISSNSSWVAGAKATREIQVSRLITEQEKELKKEKEQGFRRDQEELTEKEKQQEALQEGQGRPPGGGGGGGGGGEREKAEQQQQRSPSPLGDEM